MRPEGSCGVFCMMLLVCAAPVAGATYAQWEFNGNFDSAVGGAPLSVEAVAPAGAPETEFLAMDINGTDAQVAGFSRGTVFRFTHDLGTNGGGIYLNIYTLIMDVMFPADRTDFTALLQTNQGAGADGDWFIRGDGGLGISGEYGGMMTNAEWHRLALVVDSAAGTFTSFLDGAQVQQLAPASVTVDGRWSLSLTAQLFADDDQENWGGYINSVQLRAYAMTAGELADLAGAEAEGIPAPPVDECVPASAAEDCNGNGVKDSCDIKFATSLDCNQNGVPDECEIAADPSKDCDKNKLLDECELSKFDCNGNGILDACDIASGLLPDCNKNGIPDACEMGLAQWDFNGDLAEAHGGEELVPYGTGPVIEPAVTYETAQIGGQEAQVVRFGRGTAFQMPHGLGANAGGLLLNRYTLLMDVMFPDRSASGGWAVLFQTAPDNGDDGDWFINPDGGVGISGNYGGTAGDGNWHRLALVLDPAKGTYTSYVDGVFAQENQVVEIDGRFAIPAVPLLFADQSAEDAEGLVNSVQLRRYPMSAEEIAALAGPAAAGLPANDCNANGIPDACDIAGGASVDADGNGVPDECERPPETRFKRGDANSDASLNIADAIFNLSYLFAQKDEPKCMKTADANDDGKVNIADAIALLGHLFGNTGPLKAPFADCGTDPTSDPLTCVEFPPCPQ